MIDKSVFYAGIKLKNPIIAASCGLTGNLKSIKSLYENNIGAVVLKSLFEEQILYTFYKDFNSGKIDYPEAYDYIKNYTKSSEIEDYIKLIKEVKKELPDLPVFASVNCVSSKEWIEFSKKIEDAGADAIELNIMFLNTNFDQSCIDVENRIIELISNLAELINIPLTIKLSSHYTSFANFIKKIEWISKVKGIVLFNRHYSIDFDINTLTIKSSNTFTHPNEYTESLRWVAILSGKIRLDISATTGIWNGETVIKQLLAGAKTVQIASVLYKNGFGIINTLIKYIDEWMNSKNYKNIEEFRGLMSLKKLGVSDVFERIQFMKYFSEIH